MLLISILKTFYSNKYFKNFCLNILILVEVQLEEVTSPFNDIGHRNLVKKTEISFITQPGIISVVLQESTETMNIWLVLIGKTNITYGL